MQRQRTVVDDDDDDDGGSANAMTIAKRCAFRGVVVLLDNENFSCAERARVCVCGLVGMNYALHARESHDKLCVCVCVLLLTTLWNTCD